MKKSLLLSLALMLQGFTGSLLAASTSTPTLKFQISSPFPPGSSLSNLARAGTVFVQGAIGGYSYQVESSTDLVNWTSVNTTVAPPWGDFGVVVPVLSDYPAFFFRVKQLGETVVLVSDLTTPSYQIAAAGSINVTASVIRLRIPVSDGWVQTLPVKLTSGKPFNVPRVTLWDGAVYVGYAIFNGATTKALAYFPGSLFLKGGVDKRLTVKVDLMGVDPQNYQVVSGDLITVDYDDDPAPGMEAIIKNAKTSERIQVSGSTHSGGIRIFKSYPTLNLEPLPTTGISDGRVIRCKITANAAGPVNVGQLALQCYVNGCRVTGLEVFGFTDSSYTQPLSGFGLGGRLTANLEADETGLWRAVFKRSDGKSGALEIPAGGSYYLEGRVLVQPNSGVTAYGVFTTLPLDSLLPTSVLTDFASARSQAGNFIWSPNSRTRSSSLAESDWTTGVGISGLSRTDLYQVRTN